MNSSSPEDVDGRQLIGALVHADGGHSRLAEEQVTEIGAVMRRVGRVSRPFQEVDDLLDEQRLDRRGQLVELRRHAARALKVGIEDLLGERLGPVVRLLMRRHLWTFLTAWNRTCILRSS